MPEAARTIVKSPPELWAEVSDPAALARHLGAFGEIRITRLEPEATVAWEGDRASGTVELEPAGWGTRVKVVAQPDEAPPEPEPEPESQTAELPAIEEPEAEEPEPEVEPVRRGMWSRMFRRRAKERSADAPAIDEPEPEPEPAPEPVAVASEPDPVEPEPEPAEPALDTAAILDGMLDSLGAAHHRPFSRG